MSIEEIEEIRILMDKMDKNLMSFWGQVRSTSDEIEVRDYINGESEYGHKGKVIFLLQEIKDVFIVLEVTDNTIKFEYDGFGMSNSTYFPFFDKISTVDLLKVYIHRFEESMIHLFKFVKMNYITEREFMLEYLEND